MESNQMFETLKMTHTKDTIQCELSLLIQKFNRRRNRRETTKNNNTCDLNLIFRTLMISYRWKVAPS